MASPDRLEHYYRVGLEALRIVEGALARAGMNEPRSILDLPSGYGRVLRMLRSRFPEAAITACDLDPKAVEFCRRTFHVDGAISERSLGDLKLPRKYELIWCGSLLTHLPEDACRHALGAFQRHLEPGGILVVTTHGARVAESLGSGRLELPVEEPRSRELLRGYEDAGFGFAPYSHSPDGSYGYSLASTAWVAEGIHEVGGLTLLSSSEAAWDKRQDVYICRRARG